MTVLRPIETALGTFPFEALESSDGAAALLRIRTLVPEILILMEELFDAAKALDEPGFVTKREIFSRQAQQLQKEYENLRRVLGFPAAPEACDIDVR